MSFSFRDLGSGSGSATSNRARPYISNGGGGGNDDSAAGMTYEEALQLAAISVRSNNNNNSRLAHQQQQHVAAPTFVIGSPVVMASPSSYGQYAQPTPTPPQQQQQAPPLFTASEQHSQQYRVTQLYNTNTNTTTGKTAKVDSSTTTPWRIGEVLEDELVRRYGNDRSALAALHIAADSERREYETMAAAQSKRSLYGTVKSIPDTLRRLLDAHVPQQQQQQQQQTQPLLQQEQQQQQQWQPALTGENEQNASFASADQVELVAPLAYEYASSAPPPVALEDIFLYFFDYNITRVLQNSVINLLLTLLVLLVFVLNLRMATT